MLLMQREVINNCKLIAKYSKFRIKVSRLDHIKIRIKLMIIKLFKIRRPITVLCKEIQRAWNKIKRDLLILWIS